MEDFIALYRGINLAGRNSVKMERLRALHTRLGHRDVVSYIQSGNVVFSAAKTAERAAQAIAAEFPEDFGFSSHVLVLPAGRWHDIARANPFAKLAASKPTTVHGVICDRDPDEQALKALLARVGGTERFKIRGRVIYLHAPDGFGVSKFAAGMERASGVHMTVRNWRTMDALSKLLTDRGQHSP